MMSYNLKNQISTYFIYHRTKFGKIVTLCIAVCSIACSDFVGSKKREEGRCCSTVDTRASAGCVADR